MKSIEELLHNEGFRAVLLIVIGWILGQLNSYFAARKERKGAVSCALSDLLEVRHQFVGLGAVVEEIGKLANIPEHEKSQVLVLFDSLLPKWEELHHRYDQSVTMIAEIDPLLAFQLRSKDFLRPLMRWLHSLMGQDSNAAALMAPLFKNIFVSKVEPLLDKSIIRLARKKSPLCWYQARQLLKNSQRIPDEIRELMGSMKAAAEAQMKATRPAAAAAAQPDAQQ